MIDVKVGQIWKDNNPRTSDRYLEISEIRGEYVYAYVKRNGIWQTKQTKIKLTRFKPNSTGYVLIAGN